MYSPWTFLFRMTFLRLWYWRLCNLITGKTETERAQDILLYSINTNLYCWFCIIFIIFDRFLLVQNYSVIVHSVINWFICLFIIICIGQFHFALINFGTSLQLYCSSVDDHLCLVSSLSSWNWEYRIRPILYLFTFFTYF